MEEKVILVKEIEGKNYKLVSGPTHINAEGIELYCRGCVLEFTDTCILAGSECSRLSYSGDNENCVWKEAE